MGVGTTHHVEIGGVGYICKFDSRNVFQRTYQQPFINRESVAVSRSEGDYGQHLVFTQRSWNQGEGQGVMVSGGESKYYTSSNLDISGSLGGLTLLKGVTAVSGVSPDFGTADVNLEADPNGVWASWPTNNVQKYIWRYNGSTWDSTTTLPAELNGHSMTGMCACKGYIFLSFSDGSFTGVVRRSDNWTVDWATGADNYAIATDGNKLVFSRFVIGGSGLFYTRFYTAVPTATAPATFTSVSSDLDGQPVQYGICQHAGTMYSISYIAGAELTMLYRYDGSNFVLWKVLPDGFKGQSICSDGSVLYIGGVEKCAEGNHRGQIYYLTGSAASETLGKIATFGERDGTSDYEVVGMRPHGNSTYFSWPFYGGLGRYDSIGGGISRSYRQTTVSAEANTTDNIRVFNGDVYFIVKGSGANDTILYKTGGSTYMSTGQLDSSYIDFGLPSTEKLYNSITVMTTTQLGASNNGDIAVYYSTNLNTGTWTLLEDSLAGLTADSDSSTNFYKYTVAFAGGGIKAHSLAYRVVLTPKTGATATPIITGVSVNAMTLQRAPGKTRPNRIHRFNLVIAKECQTINEAIERGQQSTKLTNLRNILDSQAPTTLKTIAEPGTSYYAVIANLSEVAANYSTEAKTFEATVEAELMEV